MIVCSLLAVFILAITLTNGVVSARVACMPHTYTCTTDASAYSKGNITCRCEKAPNE
jgi:hypothetical protein